MSFASSFLAWLQGIIRPGTWIPLRSAKFGFRSMDSSGSFVRGDLWESCSQASTAERSKVCPSLRITGSRRIRPVMGHRKLFIGISPDDGSRDSCCAMAIPWRPGVVDSGAALLHDLPVLRALDERARKLGEDCHAPASEEAAI